MTSSPPTPAGDLPSAAADIDRILEEIGARRCALFLDYDGTLTPIVDRPEDAVLTAEMRSAIADLARCCTVAVVSGRDLADVRDRVGIDGIYYAGSHGFDLSGPDGWRHEHPEGSRHLPALDAAERALRSALDTIPGAQVERKRFAVAIHYRRVAGSEAAKVAAAVEHVAADQPGLRRTGGKKIFELRPAVDWDKGRAVLWLLDALGLDVERVASLYVGDDDTDEDAFRALAGRGIGILVRDEDRPTHARYALDSVDEAQTFLRDLCRALESRA